MAEQHTTIEINDNDSAELRSLREQVRQLNGTITVLIGERNYARARAAKLAGAFVAVELAASSKGYADYDEIQEAYEAHAVERDL